MQWKNLIKGIAFVAIFMVLFSCASTVLVSSGDVRNYQHITGFFVEPDNTLDAVYVSSSTGYAFWNSLYAWDRYGIAVYPFCSNSQHFLTAEYLIREMRKSQPDALYIVNTNAIHDERLYVEAMHHSLDDLPFSVNKMKIINRLSKAADLSWEETLELYIPMYRYHDRWSKLGLDDFRLKADGMKSASTHPLYMKEIVDIAELYKLTDERAPLAAFNVDAANSLMDYCEEENVKILFITVPRAEEEGRLKEINELNAMLEARGFTVLNLLKDHEVLGLDLTQDFYNEGHTNVHGSLKYTRYLAEYLMEHYGMENKHGDATYASWDTGYDRYEDVFYQAILDFELEPEYRTVELEKPENLAALASGAQVSISWDAVEGAEGYAVYRKQDGRHWERIETVDGLSCTDTTAQSGATYVYTVVPFMTNNDQIFYGKFDYAGAGIQLP